MPLVEEIGQEHRLAAIEWAVKKLNYSIDRPNMNRRPISEALDDKIMGDIATIAICQFLRRAGLKAIAYDQIRKDNFELPDPGWDILVASQHHKLNTWGRSTLTPCNLPDYAVSLSVRSSRLPKTDTIEKAMKIRDFKVFDNHNGKIELDLTADIETQVYYDLEKTKLYGNITNKDVQQALLSRHNCTVIEEKLGIQSRFDSCYLASWNFASNIINHCKTLEMRGANTTWPSYHGGETKRMWKAPLSMGQSFDKAYNMLKK